MKTFSILRAAACALVALPSIVVEGFTPVVGVPSQVLKRVPIAQLQTQNPDVFNMYVLAVSTFMAKPDNDVWSWFRIAGIHGYPYQTWEYPSSSIANQGYGYCTHHSTIFTTWHRPYLAIMEQLIQAEAVWDARLFTGPDATRWQNAAKAVRLPYWDWSATDQQGIPDVLNWATIQVTRPGAGGAPEKVTITNPLRAYVVPPEHQFAIGQTTWRDGNANNNFLSTFSSRRQQTMNLFSIPDYASFSKAIEGIHDNVHVTVGGSMAVINYSAFDPIFFLHHVNVDRLMAMYQVIRPGSIMTPGPRQPTLALPAGGTDDLYTPLYPFRHPNGVEWNSNDVKAYQSIFSLGYAYPEVQPSGGVRRNMKRRLEGEPKDTLAAINSLYGPDKGTPAFTSVTAGPDPNTRLEWNAQVYLDPSEVDGSCRIELFISDDQHPTDGKVGTAPVLTGPGMKKDIMNFTVPLTKALENRGHATLDPNEVLDKLKKELHWTIQRVGSSSRTIPVTDLPSFRVSVYSQPATYYDDDLPTKGEPTTFYGPTTDKQGGLKRGEKPLVGTKIGD